MPLAVVNFLKTHLSTQAFGDSAEIVSGGQESELMSLLKASCKKPYCLQSRMQRKFFSATARLNQYLKLFQWSFKIQQNLTLWLLPVFL